MPVGLRPSSVSVGMDAVGMNTISMNTISMNTIGMDTIGMNTVGMDAIVISIRIATWFFHVGDDIRCNTGFGSVSPCAVVNQIN